MNFPEEVTGQGVGTNIQVKRPHDRDQGEPLNMGGYWIWPAWRDWARQVKTPQDTPYDEKFAQTTNALTKLKRIWQDKSTNLRHKIRLLCALVLAIFFYACEKWTLNAVMEKNIQATEMRCYRRILGISYRDHITNAKIREIITKNIGLHNDLLTTVKKRKLTWFGHVTRSNGLAKTILQGMVEGGRRRFRQKRKWVDDIHD